MFTLVDAGGGPRDVVGEWHGPATLGQLITAAGAAGPYAAAAVWVDGRSVPPDQPLDRAGVVDGSVVSLTYAAAAVPSDPAAGIHLAVVGGPASGQLLPLGPGRQVLGRAGDHGTRIADRAVSGRHFAIDVDPVGGATIEDLGSSNGTMVDGRRIEGTVALEPGQLVVVGDSFLELRTGVAADAVVHPSQDGYELRRPPRLRPAPLVTEVDWPVEPGAPGAHSLPLASALVPLVMGGVLYAVTHSTLMLLFILMSPVLAVTSTVTDRRSGKTRYREEMAAFRDSLARADVEVAAALRAEAIVRRSTHPDPAVVLTTVAGPRRRLWERRRSDEDFLELRVGLATLPAQVRRITSAPYAPDLDPLEVPVVPCALSLMETGVMGIAGDPATGSGLAAWLVGQAVSLSGPADMRLVVLAGESPGAERRWGWTKWLPHVAPIASGAPASMGTTRATIETRTRELVELIDQRQRARESHRARLGDLVWPAVLVVLDPAHDLRRVPGIDTVLQRGPDVGVVALCVEESEGYLPVECRAVVVADPSGRGRLRRSGQPDVSDIALDHVDDAWTQVVGRRLGRLRDPEVQTLGGSIPGSVRLVDLLGLDHLGAEAIGAGWQESRRSTAAVVGAGIDGPFELDLRADGPHGLVAGTTGAGKSEFLQTLVASLAVVNRPDALTFLLIDYKGGSAFRDCALLPHTVGVVTDLDGHLTERALTSLSAELKRREELLARGGAKDIDDYITLREPVGPMPRLVLVIDEFAGLVSELPEFVTGLVGIAQRGRSLGIHLILATQRPSGVVSPEIRANTNLRVALRVTSPAESVDIIDAPDAAMIATATPGRAYSMTGHSSLSLFQSARVGGPAAAIGPSQEPTVALAPAGWDRAGIGAALSSGGAAGADPADTDLARLVQALISAATAAGVVRQPQPWLPPLPELLALPELGERVLGTLGDVQPVALGLVDLPAVQAQQPFVYDLPRARHLLVGGSPGTGRTTFLRTLAAAITGAHRPEDVWLYAVDCGGGELRRFSALPHCGAVVTRTEPDRTDRLLGRLRREMDSRLDRLAQGGYTDLAEQRAAVAPDDRLPYVVVLIDRWEGFMSAFDPIDGGRLIDAVMDLAREGGSVGIRLVITGDRSLLLGKLAGIVEDRVCLSLAEPADYSLAGLDPRKVPPNMGPGRAVRGGDQAELQIAVPGEGASGAAQAAAMTEMVQWWQTQMARIDPGGRAPFRVDALPAEVTMAEVASTVHARPHAASWALIGLGGDELTAIGVDLAASGGGFVVAGPRRSGRSTTLVVMAESLIDGGSSVIALCPRSSPLRSLRGRPGVIGVIDGEDPPISDLLDLLNQASGPLTVFIDDANLVHNSQAGELLEKVARDGSEQGHSVVIAGTPDELMRPMRGFIVEVRQSRSGLMLCPESHLHADVIGARLPRSAVFSQPTGRGILITDAGQLGVQVPLPEPAAAH